MNSTTEVASNALANVTPAGPSCVLAAPTPFVEFFLAKLVEVHGSNAKTAAEIASTLDLTAAQVKAWLKAAMQQGLVAKSTRPVLYRVVSQLGPGYRIGSG